MTNDIIEHYGKKGMKWGVRNDKKKTSRKGPISKFKERRARVKSEKTYHSEWAKKYHSRKNMSDKELQNAVNRLRLENELANQLRTSKSNLPSTMKRMKRYSNNMRTTGEFLSNANTVYNTGSTAYKNTRRLMKVAGALL